MISVGSAMLELVKKPKNMGCTWWRHGRCGQGFQAHQNFQFERVVSFAERVGGEYFERDMALRPA